MHTLKFASRRRRPLSPYLEGDASTQQLMKRLLFPHEAWERGPLRETEMIVLSGLDDIVASDEIFARFTQSWPRCNVVLQRQWQHGGFLLEPDPERVNEKIVRFAAGLGDGSEKDNTRGGQAWVPRGAVKRLWQVVFAKRDKKNTPRERRRS